MRSGHFEAIWSSLAPLLAKLANCPEGFLGIFGKCLRLFFQKLSNLLSARSLLSHRASKMLRATGHARMVISKIESKS